MRDYPWLKEKLDEIWIKYFPDIPRENKVLITFKGRWKNKFGHIQQLPSKNTWIAVNKLFQDERVPEYIVNLTIAHELAHSYLMRMRSASGAAKDAIYPAITPTETARCLTRTIIDEYYADSLAALIVNHLCTKTINGVSSPAHVWDIFGQTYLESLKQHVSKAGEVFPGHVNSYRTWQIPLEEMWGKVQSATEHLFVMYIHARALADATGEEVLIFDSPEIKQLPFMQKYIQDSSTTFLNRFRKHRPLHSIDAWKKMEEDVVPAGELAFKEIWQRLGLTFQETAPQQPFNIIVSEPA